jgi:hypothetical protein
MRKTRYIYCQIQGKGGAGKSFLTYLLAIKNYHDKNVLFIDADFNSQTSSTQNLRFILPKNDKDRVVFFNILDGQKNIERKLFMKMLKRFGENDFDFERVFIDFGTLESDQFLELFITLFEPGALKDLEKEFNLKFIFQVVLAGNTNYLACMSYLQKVQQIFGEYHDIIIYPNLEKFSNSDKQLEQLKVYAERFKLPCKPFGDFGKGSETETDVRLMTQQGKYLDDFPDMLTQWMVEQEIQNL